MSEQINKLGNSQIARLASRQLEAYNRADLEAFCACYHPNVLVYDAQGQITVEVQKLFELAMLQCLLKVSLVQKCPSVSLWVNTVLIVNSIGVKL